MLPNTASLPCVHNFPCALPFPGMPSPTSSGKSRRIHLFQDPAKDSFPLTYSNEVNPSSGPPLCLVHTFITLTTLFVRHLYLGIKGTVSNSSSAPLLAILACSGCYNYHRMGDLNNRHLFLMILEAGKAKIKVPADLIL